MKLIVSVFDEHIKIALHLFFQAFMKLLSTMDLLKIFRMQEPVPKDLLSKNPEIGKYREVVQEKDVLLRNSKARIRELEQQVADLEKKYRELEIEAKPQNGKKVIQQYETLYLKIMAESQEIVGQKQQAESNLNEMQIFCKDLMEKYQKAKNVIQQHEETRTKLKNQLVEYEDIINSLTGEYNRLKEYMQNRIGDADSISGIQQQAKFKDFLNKGQMQRDYSKSMFEPLKGLDSH